MASDFELGVYETFEDLFGHKSTLDEVIKDIRLFSQESVLWLCALFVTGLQLSARMSSEPSNVYLLLISLFFDGNLQARLIARSRNSHPKRVLFHRRQALLLAKLAILHCSIKGVNARTSPLQFGPILLKANDQFDYGLLAKLVQEKRAITSRDDYAQVITEMLAVGEHASPEIPFLLTRSHLMLTRFAEELRGDADFIDLAREHQKATGLTIEEFEAMIFGVHSRFGEELAKTIHTNPGALPLKSKDFETTAVSKAKISTFLDLLSASPSQMAQDIRLKDNGPNDFTIFRKLPLVQQFYDLPFKTAFCGYLMMDNLFFLEKVITGPYWTANSTHGEKLHRFWGSVFEKYVNELMKQASIETSSLFIPDPRLPSDPNIQICDGIVIAGDSIVLMEYKSNMFRADSKYSGDYLSLAAEIKNKLVQDKTSASRKGVWQLSEAVKTLFGPGASNALPGTDLSKIKHVYLYLITLDSIGGAIGLAPFLETFLIEKLDRQAYESIEIRPLFCSDIETFEKVTGFLEQSSLPQTLEQWYLSSPTLAVPLRAVDLDWSYYRENGWLQIELKSIFMNVVKILFPNEDPEIAVARALKKKS
jgi:hypothetical protein